MMLEVAWLSSPFSSTISLAHFTFRTYDRIFPLCTSRSLSPCSLYSSYNARLLTSAYVCHLFFSLSLSAPVSVSCTPHVVVRLLEAKQLKTQSASEGSSSSSSKQCVCDGYATVKVGEQYKFSTTIYKTTNPTCKLSMRL